MYDGYVYLVHKKKNSDTFYYFLKNWGKIRSCQKTKSFWSRPAKKNKIKNGQSRRKKTTRWQFSLCTFLLCISPVIYSTVQYLRCHFYSIVAIYRPFSFLFNCLILVIQFQTFACCCLYIYTRVFNDYWPRRDIQGREWEFFQWRVRYMYGKWHPGNLRTWRRRRRRRSWRQWRRWNNFRSKRRNALKRAKWLSFHRQLPIFDTDRLEKKKNCLSFISDLIRFRYYSSCCFSM